MSNVGVGSNNQVLTTISGNLSWQTPTTGTVTSVSGTLNRITSTGGATPVIDISASYVGQSSITTLGTITGTWTGTNIALANGGTNATLTASNGGIFYSTSTAGAILSGTATAGQLLQSGASAAPTWSTATYPSTATSTGTILRANGTNWVATTATYPNTVTVGDILYASSANVVGSLADVATGQVLISGGVGAVPSYSATPTVTSITFGAGNALSAYVEGTFTPTMVGTVTGTTTYTVQNGYYRRIGNLVQVQGNTQGSAATGTGNIVFGALPFTVKNQSNANAMGSILSASAAGWTWPASSTSLVFSATLNATTGTIYVCGSGTVGGNLQMANAAFNFQYNVCYEI